MRTVPVFVRSTSVLLLVALVLYGVPRLAAQKAPVAAPLAARDPFAQLLADSVDLGPVKPRQGLSLLLTLRDATAPRLAADVAAIYSLGSPRFHHYLTAQALAARYGPPVAAVGRLRARLARLGLQADWQRGNNWLMATGPARSMEAAFGVRVHWYRSPRGIRYYAGAQAPRLPAALRPLVASTGRFSSYLEPSSYSVPAGGLSPADLLAAYDIKPLRDLGLDGTGQTVAFFEFDGFAQSDLNTFTSKYGLPAMTPIIKAGPAQPPGGETTMDLEVVHEIAPGAKLVLYNVDLSGAKSNADVAQVFLDLQTRMVNENPGGILSQSWGVCEQELGSQDADAVKNVYDHADALGESVLVSTGDNGAYECLRDRAKGTPPLAQYRGVPLPADAPGVTAVGGTRISVSANQGWYNETVWEDPIMTAGTGGGPSAYFARPSWQQGPGVQDTQFNPQNMRSIPDVSADADPASGAAIFGPAGNTSDWIAGGGTSQSAPIWAGITALINQYLESKNLKGAGFLNPALYQIAQIANPYRAFHDITVGSNLYYPATPNYDMASGLGTPDAWNLARDLEALQNGTGQ
jgi:kumamolisin